MANTYDAMIYLNGRILDVWLLLKNYTVEISEGELWEGRMGRKEGSGGRNPLYLQNCIMENKNNNWNTKDVIFCYTCNKKVLNQVNYLTKISFNIYDSNSKTSLR